MIATPIKREKKPAIRPVLINMKVFEKAVFPAERTAVVRATIHLVNIEFGFEFITRVDKNSKTIEVIKKK